MCSTLLPDNYLCQQVYMTRCCPAAAAMTNVLCPATARTHALRPSWATWYALLLWQLYCPEYLCFHLLNRSPGLTTFCADVQCMLFSCHWSA